MTQPQRPLKVFLCHAHADRDAVRALYKRLTNDGVDAWLDKENLLGGQNWQMEIRTAVEEADVVVVCHSKEFNKEGFRQREVKWALDVAMEKPEGEIFIIPARLEECEIIKSLRDWHWVDLFEKDGYEMLFRSLQGQASKIDVTLKSEKSRTHSETLYENKRESSLTTSSVALNTEIIIPVASPMGDFVPYLRDYFARQSRLLFASPGVMLREERETSFEWQTLLFKSKTVTEVIDGKAVNVANGQDGEKIGVFSVSRLSLARSKLTITRSSQGEEFITFILTLIEQLRNDNLIDGAIRGLS